MSTGVLIAAGVALGVVYSLSPMLVWSVLILGLLLRWVAKDLSGRERDWFWILFVSAIAVRILIVGALCLSADGSKPYTVFFGDEWIFKSRPIWLRNVALGIPISTADAIYAFDDTGMSGHLWVLAYLQSLVGDAPYGVHLFNITLYVGAVTMMYRVTRRSFGALTAFGGSAVLLFMPSLFMWSVSALKEPTYISIATLELLVVLLLMRGPGVWRRVVATPLLVGLVLSMEELRKGTMMVAAVGIAAGLASWWILQRPWRIAAAAVAAPVLAVVALMQAPVQARAMNLVQQSIKYHAGHVVTAGVTYQLVDPRIYHDWALIPKIDGREAAQFVVRAAVAYFVEPTPDKMQSRQLWAYLPEHIFWLTLMVLVPVGITAGARRDPGLTSLLAAHAAAIVMMVALASGNIGTLIRHRGLSLPYLVWFSILGAVALIARLQSRALASNAGER